LTEQREKIAVLGIGKLGICFALNLERSGYDVVGVDVDENYVQAINSKTLKSYEPGVERYLQNSTHFKATTNINEAIDAETALVFIMVATPSLPDGSYNHAQIEHVAERLMQFGKQQFKKHIIIGCTTMPGYCDTLAALLAPYNYTVSYNPEFIAQGNIIHDQQYPDQVLIGEADKETGDKIVEVYKKMCLNQPVYCRMNRLSAEICKLATNCFLTMKISFANSMGDFAIRAGADPDKILSAIGSDSRIGSKYIRYGFGFGGPCFSRDNRALALSGKQHGMDLHLSYATDVVNKQHLDFQFKQYMEQYPSDEVISFDHVSYKKGSVILEESQQLALALRLAREGRKVLIKDVPAVVGAVKKLYGDLFLYEESKD